MKILFIGEKSGSSNFNFLSIKKIFSNTEILNIEDCLTNFENFIFYHFYPDLFNSKIYNFYKKNVIKNYDLIFINNVNLLNKKSVKFIKLKAKKILFFSEDNPFLKRDKFRWKLLKETLVFFDHIYFMQKNREKYINKNIKNYFFTLPVYYQNIHKLYKKNKKKNIVFIGTWFPERSKFLSELKKLGLEFDIYGNRWEKDKKNYNILKENIKGPLPFTKVGLVASCYKINLGLLSKGNDDDITRRCIEVPAVGSLLCCERSKTMNKTLKENHEAIYFSSSLECFKKCEDILADRKRLNHITKNGSNKIRKILKLEAKNLFRKILNFRFLNSSHKKFITRY